MTTVHIIFAQPHHALRDTHGFKEGQEIKEVTFNVVGYQRLTTGVELNFDGGNTTYFYPWHTIARLKVTE